jgi:acyl dehydratase
MVSADDINRFTQISGDRNPLHYDAAAAKASRFGEIVVQGGITSAILNAVVAESLPGPGTVFMNVNWDFTAPVRPGDVITGRVEVLEARADKPVTKLRTTVVRGDGTVALTGTAVCYTLTLTTGTSREGAGAGDHDGRDGRTGAHQEGRPGPDRGRHGSGDRAARRDAAEQDHREQRHDPAQHARIGRLEHSDHRDENQ